MAGELGDEERAAYEGPAPLVNRFFVSANANFVRISFIEETVPVGAKFFRSAAVMSVADAEELGRTLVDFAAKVRGQGQEGAR